MPVIRQLFFIVLVAVHHQHSCQQISKDHVLLYSERDFKFWSGTVMNCGEKLMLSDKLRDGANSKAFKTLLALIIVSFVLTGVGGYLIPRLNTDPVTVGDYKISANEWTDQYNRQANQLHRIPNGSDLLENPEYVASLKKQVLERMIDNVAFNAAVWDMDVRIGDEQVRDVIRRSPAFQKDGRFNNELYLASVRNMGMNPDYYGEQLRVSLMTEAVARPVITASTIPLPFELDNVARIISQSRTVDLYTVDAADIEKGITASDEEAKAFYDANHNRFMAPATVRFNYLLLSVNDLRKEVEVTDEKLEEYFNMYSEDFTLPEQRRAAHIVIRKGSKDYDKRLAAVEKGIKDGKSFAELAKKYSDDKATASKGGDMGLFSRGEMAANLDAAVFAMTTAGQVSDRIDDETGAHFVSLTEIVEPHAPELAAVKDKVRDAYITAQARDLYNQRVTTMSDLSFENPDSLDVTAEALKLEIKNSGLLDQGDTKAAWPLDNAAVQGLAFNEEVYNSGVNSQVISIDDDNSIVINVTEHHDAALRNFDEVKADAVAMVKKDKLNVAINKALEKVAMAVTKDENAALPENVTARKGVVLSPSVDAVGPEFNQAVYALPVDTQKAWVIASNNGTETLGVLRKVSEPSAEDLKTYAEVMNVPYAQYLNMTVQNSLNRQARTLNDIVYNDEAINLVTRTAEQE